MFNSDCKLFCLINCISVGTDDGEEDIDKSSVGGKLERQMAGKKLSAKTIKAVLELICDEAVSQTLTVTNMFNNIISNCFSIIAQVHMNSVVNLFFVVETILLQLCFDYSCRDKQPVATQIQQVYCNQSAKTYIFLLKSVMLNYFNSIFCILCN